MMAYFFGKKFGKNKVFPNISPNKTLEGLLSGIISTSTISIIYAYYFSLDILHYTIIGFIIAISGILGDLSISYFKRQFNLKDTSSLIPGHGGILDRYDSYLFCMPISLLLIELV